MHHHVGFITARLSKKYVLFNAIARGPFPTWVLSTGVDFGGKTENVDRSVVVIGAGAPLWAARG